MPRVKKHTARQNIYAKGVQVPDPKTKSGYRCDRSKPADESDPLLVAYGQQYYTWKFRNGGQRISLTRPTRQQLTQSDFLIQVYDLEDRLADIEADPETLESELSEIADEIRELAEEQEGKLENMPESLQYSPVAELLRERGEALHQWQDSINSIDCCFEEKYDDESDEDFEARKEEWVQEKMDEIGGCESGL